MRLMETPSAIGFDIARLGHSQQPDPLGASLHLFRMSGLFYSPTSLRGPWGLSLPPMAECLWFHVVTAGAGWIEVTTANDQTLPPFAVREGDLVVVPHGLGHTMYSEEGVATPSVLDMPQHHVTDQYALLSVEGDGPLTTAICGGVRFEHPAARHLVDALPPVIHIRSADGQHSEWLGSTLRLMAIEASELRPGGEAVITRLSDILVIHAIRAWIESEAETAGGWLGALADPQVGQAISAVHAEPERPWTVALLASEVGMSRSAFAARFTELVGETAMAYVARWRMHVATDRLREGSVSVAVIARDLGYESEASFSRAFKRVVGTTPGRVRRGADLAPST